MLKNEHPKDSHRGQRWTVTEGIILGVLIILAGVILLQPKYLRNFDQLAEHDVEQEYRASVYNTAKLNYPKLPEGELQRLTDERISQLHADGELQQKIAERAAQYRAGFQDEDGVTYLTHVDSYLYLRYADTIRKTGTYGEQLSYEPKTLYDPLRNAPFTEVLERSPFPYFLVFLYRLLHSIAPQLTFSAAVAVYPVLFGTLLVAVLYILVRAIAGIRAAQFASLALATHAQFFAAFQWGYADTNALNVLCGALLLALAYALVCARSWLWRSVVTACAIAVFVLFRQIWIGSTVFAALAGGALLFMLGSRAWNHVTLRRYIWKIIIAIAFLMMLGAMLFFRHPIWQTIKLYLSGGIGGAVPNPFPYIGEFKTLTIGQWIAALGGPIALILFVIGVVVLCLGSWHKPYMRPGAILLLVWLAALAYPSLRIRFLQFFVVPFVAVMGIGATWCWQHGVGIAQRKLPHRLAQGCVSVLLIVLLLSSTIPMTVRAIGNANPVMNDALATIAQRIRTDSPPNAIIATWWNNGYLYQYFAERGTYFDGANFDSGFLQSYSMSRYFMETDRRIAQGILHTMSCDLSGFLMFRSVFPNHTMEGINVMLQLDRDSAAKFLREQLGEEFSQRPDNLSSPSEQLLAVRHCINPRETYVVVSEDMLNILWAFDWYAKVDFEHPEKPISGRSEYNSAVVSCNTLGTKIFCEQGITADIASGKAKDPLGRTMPFFFNDGQKLYRPQEDVPPNRPMVIFYVDGNRLKAALINSDLLNTMFVRLFFFNGEGMPEYEKIAEAGGPYQPRIVAYKINFTTQITS